MLFNHAVFDPVCHAIGRVRLRCGQHQAGQPLRGILWPSGGSMGHGMAQHDEGGNVAGTLRHIGLRFGHGRHHGARFMHGAEQGVDAVLVDNMGIGGIATGDGDHRLAMAFGQLGHAYRRFAKDGLTVDAALAGDDPVGLGNVCF